MTFKKPKPRNPANTKNKKKVPLKTMVGPPHSRQPTKPGKDPSHYLEHGTTSTEETKEALQLLGDGHAPTLAQTLISIRTCEEISQAEFARMLGISRQRLNDIEKGRREINLEMAAKFARALGYPESYFVRLALQTLVSKAGLDLIVEVSP